MDREKFKTITDKLMMPFDPRRLAERSRPVEEHCGDCDRVVKGRTVEFYVRGFGTHRATWMKKCVNCSKKAPISTFPDK
jgi:hypothetical protein